MSSLTSLGNRNVALELLVRLACLSSLFVNLTPISRGGLS